MRLTVSGLLLAAVLTATALAPHAGAADLRYGAKDLPTILGNPYTDHIAPGNPLWPALFDGLTRIDRDGALAPALALSWKLTAPNAWQFRLRRGVRFSNGEPFDARAVVAALDWLRGEDGRRTVVGYDMRGIAGVEAIEDDVVLIRTARPDALLPARLADVMMVAPEAWASIGPEAYAQKPVGTGAFTLKDVGPGLVQLDANQDSWRKPMVDRLILRVLPDKAARLKALQAGEIDIAADLAADDVDALAQAGLLTSAAPPTAVNAIVFRSHDRQPALRDVRVRQALNHAVDKGAIDKAQRGLAPEAGQPAARAVHGADPDVVPYAYDAAKAKALIDEAGFGDGFPLRIARPDRTADRAAVDVVTRDLDKLGVKVDWRVMPETAWASALAGGTWDADIDGFLTSFESAPTNDAARAMETTPCFFCDAALTAKRAASYEQMDADKRLMMLGDLAHAYHDAAPALYLNEQPVLFGIGRKIEGFSLANQAPVWERIGIRK